MAWKELPNNPPTLEASIVQDVVYDQHLLADALEELGYTVESLHQNRAYKNTQISNVQQALQFVEDNLDRLNSVENIQSIYYDEPYTIGKWFYRHNYQRWRNILYDLYSIIIEDKGMWGVLELSDCIPTINNKVIVLRGDSIGT